MTDQHIARIYATGRITLPKAIRERAGVETGGEVLMEARGSEIIVRKAPRSVFDFRPRRQYRDVGLTDREVTDVAWEEHIAQKCGTNRP